MVSPRSWITDAYEILENTFGNLHWWPAEGPLEISLGAILTQNTVWANAEKAICALKRRNLISVESLSKISEEELSEIIKPAGFFRQKAKRIKAFIDFVREEYGGDFSLMFNEEGEQLRKKLLAVYGIGAETADSILLYGGGKLYFVVDAYTRRILSRHGVMDESASYDEIQTFFMTYVPKDLYVYNQYHALLVETGKRFCRSAPRCSACPLNGLWCRDDQKVISVDR
ncbi:MAG: endonuclease III domain-containing protein [Syntrophales bacterium]|nr:endonuclease III domain-containing protein [Syntrophales bacterium]